MKTNKQQGLEWGKKQVILFGLYFPAGRVFLQMWFLIFICFFFLSFWLVLAYEAGGRRARQHILSQGQICGRAGVTSRAAALHLLVLRGRWGRVSRRCSRAPLQLLIRETTRHVSRTLLFSFPINSLFILHPKWSRRERRGIDEMGLECVGKIVVVLLFVLWQIYTLNQCSKSATTQTCQRCPGTALLNSLNQSVALWEAQEFRMK